MQKKILCVLSLGLVLAACDGEEPSDPGATQHRSISGDTVFNVLDYDASAGDCANPADTWDAIDDAITDAELVGGSVFFPEPAGGCYLIEDELVVDSPVSLWGLSRPEIRMSASGVAALSIQSSDVNVSNLAFRHPTPSDTLVGDSHGIVVPWDGTATRRNNIRIKNVYVEGFRHTGIRVEHSDAVRVEGSEIKDVSYTGIALLDVTGAFVDGNRVEDVYNTNSGNPNRVYGIISSRVRARDTVDDVSKDILVHHNRVREADLWHCYDTHGGKRNSFVGNLCWGSARGVAIGGAEDETGPNDAEPADTIVVANVLSANQVDGTAWAAVDFAAQKEGTLAPGLIAASNVARGYGEVDVVNNNLNAAMMVRTTDGALFHANNILEPFGKGLAAGWDNTDVAFVANMVTGLYGTWGRPVAYSANQDNPISGVDSNNGLISGNRAGDMDWDDHIVALERWGNEFLLGLNSSNGVDQPLFLQLIGGTTASSGHQADAVTVGQGSNDPKVRFLPGSGSASIRICDGVAGTDGDICLNPGAGDALQVWEGGAWVGK